MAELTICTALRLEEIAVRRGVRSSTTRVIRTGMGPAKTQAASASWVGNGPLAMLGVAGAIAANLKPGDVVVATEVRGVDSVTTCPSAPLVAGALRRLGLPVHLGPIVTQDTIARADDLPRLREGDAIAVDMETSVVARSAGARPFVAVRVISDVVGEPFLRPALIRNGTLALRALRRVVPAVEEWAAGTQVGEVHLASPRSFCAGVERAIDIVERALDRYGAPVYVRRQIVHNAHIVADLEQRGAIFVEELDEVPDAARVIFAAHGVAPAVRDDASRRSLSVIDATCPLVAKVHNEVRRYAARGDSVFLIGHAEHEEVVGTVGEAPGRVAVIEDERDAHAVEVDDPARVAYVMQTTLAVDEAEAVAATLRERFPALVAPRSDDICYATANRQAAIREIAELSDVVLVIGSANSSNSRRLVEVAERAGVHAHLVDDATDVDPAWLVGATHVGVTAGASAPPRLVDELVGVLAGMGRGVCHEHSATEESVTFTLPREVC